MQFYKVSDQKLSKMIIFKIIQFFSQIDENKKTYEYNPFFLFLLYSI